MFILKDVKLINLLKFKGLIPQRNKRNKYQILYTMIEKIRFY